MTPSIALTSLNLFGAALALTLAVLLLRRAGGATPRRLLGALLAIWAVAGACISMDHADVFGHERWLERIEFTLGFALGPIVLWYVRAATGIGAPSVRPSPAHFAPAAACATFGVVTACGLGRWSVPVELVLAHAMAYTAWSAAIGGPRFFGRTVAGPDVSWCRLTFGVLVVVHAAQLVRLTWPHVAALREIVPLAMNAGVLMFTVAGFGEAVAHVRPTAAAQDPEHVKYRKTALPDAAVPLLLARLHAAMTEARLYLDPDLTLAGLAAALKTTPHQLSQLLNQHAGRSFADYLAGFRIAEARRLLLDPAQDAFTIDAIAESSGFSSRSAFYAAFRRAEGMSPTDFRRRHRETRV